MQHTIGVKEFVALPTNDATPGILKAIQKAKQEQASVLEFEAGIYPLKSHNPFKTDLTAHDAGAELLPEKDVHILLCGLKNITLRGAVDKEGNPATVLSADNNLELHSLLPSLLWMTDCENITVENFKFKRDPEFCSAGRVTKIENDTLFLEVFEGNPCYDNMGTHCMNRFTPEGELNGESLSYGPGLAEKFRLVGDRLLSLKDEKVASRVETGDIITFHQGAKTDFQCYFGASKNVTLKNLHTVNANGFAFLAFDIRNLTIENVKFKPEGNQYFTAPRDAFKLHKCQGDIFVNQMYIEGVRMDGQNMHSNFLFPVAQKDKNTLVLFSRYAYLKLPENTEMECYAKGEESLFNILSVKNAEPATLDAYPGYNYTVTFKESLEGMDISEALFLARAWEPDSYVCENSVFTNIAGAGHLSRIDHMRIRNCTYKNLMNSGIWLGVEFPSHVEGGNATDIEIEGCTFIHCGNTSRCGAKGCIGMNSYQFDAYHNRDIRIRDCIFKDSDIGIDIQNAQDVHIENCTFSGVKNKICTNNCNSGKIYVDLQQIL